MKDKFPEKLFSVSYIHLLCRIVFTIILWNLILDGFANTLVHQLRSPVLKFAYVDPIYWLMHLLKIPDAIVSNLYLAWLWDIVLFASCISVLLFPRKKWFIAVFVIFYFVYNIIFNSYGAHHTHAQIAFLIAPLPFLFSQKAFSYAWEGLRYFVLFAYSAAFLWKFFRFSWLLKDQGLLIMKKNLVPFLYYHPDSFLAHIYTWFFNHPGVLQFLFVSGIFIEGVFIVGFFTKRFDRLLFFLSLLLPLGFWFFADALFFEQVIFSLTLWHLKPGSRYYEKEKAQLAFARI